MDDSAKLAAWLSRGARPNPLDAVVETLHEKEGITALLEQARQYRLICDAARSLPCYCGRTYANGVVVKRCPHH